MRKKINRILCRIFVISILFVSAFLVFRILFNYSKAYIRDRLQQYFRGSLSIREIEYTLNKIYLYNVRVSDVTAPEAVSFFHVKSVAISMPYYWLFDRSSPIDRIEVNELSMNVEKYMGNWNIQKNIIIRDSDIDKSLGLPVNELIIKKSFCIISMPITNRRYFFPVGNISADLRRKDEKLLFSMKGAVRESEYKIESTLDHIKGKDNEIDKYHIILKEFDFHGRDSSIFLEDLQGEAEIIKNNINIHNVKGLVRVWNMSFPFSKLIANIGFRTGFIDLKNLNLTIFNGTLEGKGEYNTDKFYSGEFNFNDIDISRIIKYYKGFDKEINGKLVLNVNINATKKNNWNPRGHGIVHAFDILIPEIRPIDRVNIDWKYKNKQFLLNDINITTKSKKYFGRGYITNKGKLNIYFTTESNRGILGYVPIFGYISHELKNVAFRVSGTLQEPEFDISLAKTIPGILLRSVLDVIKLVFFPVTKTIELLITDDKD